MSLLAAESARLVQVQQELQQAKESEARGARVPSRIEVSTSIGGDTNVVSSTPAPSREPPQDVATQLVYGDCRSAAANIDHLFAMYDQSTAASPLRQGTSSSSTIVPISAGRLGSDFFGGGVLQPIQPSQTSRARSRGKACIPERHEFHRRTSQALHPIPRAARKHRAV